ncbi:LOW QUALITY PROTEIN: hypothetical protein YC2023_055778 [Brassica napus]
MVELLKQLQQATQEADEARSSWPCFCECFEKRQRKKRLDQVQLRALSTSINQCINRVHPRVNDSQPHHHHSRSSSSISSLSSFLAKASQRSKMLLKTVSSSSAAREFPWRNQGRFSSASFEEVKKELDPVPTSSHVSLARQKYSDE